MSRASVFIGRRAAFKFQQRRIEPFSFSDETLMFLLERLQTRSRPFQFGLRSGSGISLRNIAPGAFEFDFRAAARAFIFELHLIGPRPLAFVTRITRVGYCGLKLSILRQISYGIRTARP